MPSESGKMDTRHGPGTPSTSRMVVGAVLSWVGIVPAIGAHLLLAVHAHRAARRSALLAAQTADLGARLLGEPAVFVAEYRRHEAAAYRRGAA